MRPSKLTCLCGPRARYSYKRYYLGETRRRAASLDAGIRRLHSHVGGAARPPRYHRKEAPVYPTPPQHTNICYSCQDWICFVLFGDFFCFRNGGKLWRRRIRRAWTWAPKRLFVFPQHHHVQEASSCEGRQKDRSSIHFYGFLLIICCCCCC